MGVVALVSGGVDSTVMCKILEKQGEKLIPIFIDYGQLAAEKEWEACKRVFKECNFPNPIKIDLNGYGKMVSSGLTNPQMDIYKDAFLPGRNMLFLLVGAAYAFSCGEKIIAIGLLTESSHLFPDQTEEFIVNANFALNSALGTNFTIITPLINFTKREVIELAKHYHIPLDKTYSCHSGKDKYCGKCIACKEIISSGEKELFPQFKEDE